MINAGIRKLIYEVLFVLKIVPTPFIKFQTLNAIILGVRELWGENDA